MINWMSLSSHYKEPRKVRVYVFSAELMFHLLSDGDDNLGLYGWPRGAEILTSSYDSLTGEMYVILEHDDFAEVEPLGLIPAVILKPTVLVKSCALCRFCVPHGEKLVCFNDQISVGEADIDFWCNKFEQANEEELEV